MTHQLFCDRNVKKKTVLRSAGKEIILSREIARFLLNINASKCNGLESFPIPGAPAARTQGRLRELCWEAWARPDPPILVGTGFRLPLSCLSPAWAITPAVSQPGLHLVAGPVDPDLDQDMDWPPSPTSSLWTWLAVTERYLTSGNTSPDLILPRIHQLVCPGWPHGLLVRAAAIPRCACPLLWALWDGALAISPAPVPWRAVVLLFLNTKWKVFIQPETVLLCLTPQALLVLCNPSIF